MGGNSLITKDATIFGEIQNQNEVKVNQIISPSNDQRYFMTDDFG